MFEVNIWFVVNDVFDVDVWCVIDYVVFGDFVVWLLDGFVMCVGECGV